MSYTMVDIGLCQITLIPLTTQLDDVGHISMLDTTDSKNLKLKMARIQPDFGKIFLGTPHGGSYLTGWDARRRDT
jgi:hypothetical protein